MIKFSKTFSKQCIATILLFTLLVSNFSSTLVLAEEPVATSSSFNLTVSKLTDSNGRADLSLQWDEMKFLGKEDGTRYYIYRKDLTTGKWEVRGRYGDAIKVLNVYPDVTGSDQLKSWMDALTAVNENVNIQVDKVKITDFNADPTNYLNTTQFNYDVVVFGFWDSNYGKDLSPEAATVISKFIDNDGGVIFGHDTMETSTKKPIFKQVVEAKTSMRASATPGTTWPNWIYSYKIKVQKQGSVTTYPCDINGMSLIIPYSHTVGQIPTNPDAVYMGFEKYTKQEVKATAPELNIDSVDLLTDETLEHYLSYYYKGSDKQTALHDVYLNYGGKNYNTNAYLTVEDNVAFIQCGHSSGKTNTAEQMVLANTIYALAKIYTGTSAKDQILDTAPPAIPTHSIENNLISFDSSDTGNGYEYRVVAIPMGVEESVRNSSSQILSAIDDPSALGIGDNIKFSNTVPVDVQGGLKNFRYTVDSVSSPTVQVDDTSVTLNGTIPVPPNSTKDTYIHVAAYDKANNVSKIHSFNLWDSLTLYKVTEKFIDIDTGLEIQPEVTTEQVGELEYVPNPEKTIQVSDSLSYDYVRSDPATITVASNETTNLINHYYKADNHKLVTERYISRIKDSKGNVLEEKVIKTPLTSYAKTGTTYQPKADVYNTEGVIQEGGIDRYIFANTNVANGLVVSDDETKNVITHYYDQLLYKNLNVVEHVTYPEVDTHIYPFSQNVVLKYGTNLDVSLATLAYHNFDGYYTIASPKVNADGSNKVDVGKSATSVNLTWLNEEPLYFHFTRKTGSAIVKIVNSNTKLPITSFETLEGNVGENLIITSDYIKEATVNQDFSTYKDSYKLKEFKTVAINNEGNNNTLIIELTPRDKNIIYYGIEFIQNLVNLIINLFGNPNSDGNATTNENLTSGSAVTLEPISTWGFTYTSDSAIKLQPTAMVGQPTIKLLNRETYTFGVASGDYTGTDKTFNIVDKFFENWAIYDSGKNFLVDFSDPTSTSYIDYYREPKATGDYTYEVNYLNEYDNSVLVPKQDTVTVNVAEKPKIEIKNIQDLNINGSSVDFEPSYVEITHPTLGTKTFAFTQDYLSFFNQKDADGNLMTGDYVVNIYYKPYVTINLVEEFLHSDLTTVLDTRTTPLKVLYDKATPISVPHTKFEYDYLLYKFNGTLVDPNNSPCSILPNVYEQTVVASYRPVVYNLGIKAYAVEKNNAVQSFKGTRATVSSGSYYISYQFDSIPASDTITIAEPQFDGFNFQSLLGANDLTITSANKIVSLKADPQKVLASMLSGSVPNYTVEALYDRPSTLTVNHIDELTNAKFKTDTITSVIGRDILVPVYEDSKRQFNKATLDGTTQSVDLLNGAITIKPTKVAQTINVYYIDNDKYALTVTSDVGGRTSGSNTGNYFVNDAISVTATADTNYEFDKWIISGVIGLDVTSETLSFSMPNNTVTLNAVFKPSYIIDDSTDTITDITDNTNDTIKDTIKDTISDTITNNITPNQPVNNNTSSNSTGELTYWEYERLYKPYIHGYPDKTMRPDSDITRVEFVAIVYNLLGEEEETSLSALNKFSDVSSNAWYSQALAFCTAHNYVTGYEDGTFRPNSPITRAELAAVIARFVKDNPTKTPFTDIENSWAKSSIEKLYSKGYIVGTSKTTFTPNNNASRAAVVTVVNRLIKRPPDWKKVNTYTDLTPKHWAYDNMMNAANGGSVYDKVYSEQLRNN